VGSRESSAEGIVNLKYLDVKQLNTDHHLIEEFDFLTEAVPPVHVLDRSSELLDQGVKPVWALAYLMLAGNRVVGCCGFKNAPVEKSVEIGYNVAQIHGGGVCYLSCPAIM